MGITASVAVFTCDCCGFSTEDMDGTFVRFAGPDGASVLLCTEKDCAAHMDAQLNTFFAAKVGEHLALKVDGAFPSHPTD